MAESRCGAIATSFCKTSRPSSFILVAGMPNMLAANSFLYRSSRCGSGANFVTDVRIVTATWGAKKIKEIRNMHIGIIWTNIFSRYSERKEAIYPRLPYRPCLGYAAIPDARFDILLNSHSGGHFEVDQQGNSYDYPDDGLRIVCPPEERGSNSNSILRKAPKSKGRS